METEKRQPWQIAYILLPSAAMRYAQTREDIQNGISKHVYENEPGSFLDTSEYARLKRQEHRREAVLRRLDDAMYDAILGGAR